MSRSALALGLVAAVVLTAACGSSAEPRPVANGTSRPGADASASSAAAVSSASGRPSGGDTAPTGTASPGTSHAPVHTGSPTPSSSWNWTATPEEIPIKATLTPACVIAGTPVRLDVDTRPKAAVAFLAVYAGEQSGAAPPFGKGYGGNDKGVTDAQGHWVATWTVAPNTPPGAAYVIVGVSHAGKQRETKVPFTVKTGAGC